MGKQSFLKFLDQELAGLKTAGLYKSERVLSSPQAAEIVANGATVLNFCANNYLGLANHPDLKKAAAAALEPFGYGLSSVRFICGTQSQHLTLEKNISALLGTEDTILYSSCFDANGGLFETLLGPDDAIISDELNHASIIDGIRLAKAKRFRYRNLDMADLEEKLKEASGARYKLIATDGVFSMDGTIAPLRKIVELAKKYDALTMVDDSHAVGFMGKQGRGTIESEGVLGEIDIITGTLGKALGGASGGYTSGHQSIVNWLRQRSRPYLFSNTLAPQIVAASIKALELIKDATELREKLHANTTYFRDAMAKAGFTIIPGSHPIVPVMIGDAVKAKALADGLLKHGIYVISFSYPVVPQGKARIRTQMSSAHSEQDLKRAVECFREVGKELGII